MLLWYPLDGGWLGGRPARAGLYSGGDRPGEAAADALVNDVRRARPAVPHSPDRQGGPVDLRLEPVERLVVEVVLALDLPSNPLEAVGGLRDKSIHLVVSHSALPSSR